MDRRARPKKGQADAQRPRVRKSPKERGGKVRDLQKRLTEALGKLQTRDHELAEALEQQTATSEVLRVISESQADAQPVFDTIAANALRLCAAAASGVYRFDGELIHLAALLNINPDGTETVRRTYPVPPSRGGAVPRSILTRDVVYIRDVGDDPEYQLHGVAGAMGIRSILAVPMLREGNPIGAIAVYAPGVGAFSDNHVHLLKTFADQAVIAIENVRLFEELEARNTDLTDALARQTATSDILGVISSSPTNVQPVFDAIVASAVRLCDGNYSTLISFDGELMHLEAAHNWTPEAFEAARHLLAAPPSRISYSGRAILDRTVIHVPDGELDREFGSSDLEGELRASLARAVGFRGILAVPMLRDGVPLGVIGVGRAEPGPFSDNQIELLQTFADQAVIAIENVRLFKELEARNRDLTAASEILRVDRRTPHHLRDAVGPRHPECPPLPRDRRQEPSARGRQPA